MQQTVQLTKAVAQELEIARRQLRLLQTDLAKNSGVAHGTVSNFLRGGRIRTDHAQQILTALAKAAEEGAKGQLRVFIFDSIGKARELVDFNIPTGGRALQQFKSFSGAPSRLLEIVMGLTDEPRTNLTKAWDYFTPEHFSAHVACIANGVSYRWLAYESDRLHADWDAYRVKLEEQLKYRHRDEVERQLQQPVSDRNVKELISDKVHCHVFPLSVQKPGQLIPFRVTVFGKSVCLCSEEVARQKYSEGMNTIVIRNPDFLELKDALETLYENCPDINADPKSAGRIQSTLKELEHCHRILREAFLEALLKNI